MSSFKGDQLYGSHADDAQYDSPNSDEHVEEPVRPPVKFMAVYTAGRVAHSF